MNARARRRARRARARLWHGTTLLVATSAPDFCDEQAAQWRSPALGRLVTPQNTGRVEEFAAVGVPWAADNDGYMGVDEAAYKRMCERVAGLPGLLWVTAPDVLIHRDDGTVVGDARATARRFDQWRGYLHNLGIPIALVAQDGLDDPGMLEWLEERWDDIACVFVGGSDAFKLGAGGRRICQLAKARGKLVHLGRVSSLQRLAYGRLVLRADTQDGTNWAANKKAPSGPRDNRKPRLRWGLDFIEEMETVAGRAAAWPMVWKQWLGDREPVADPALWVENIEERRAA